MRFLLDTCVVSEIGEVNGHAGVKATVNEIEIYNLYLSVLTVGEIAKGIGLLAAGRKRKDLASWLTGVEAGFAKRILGIDLETARLWGEMTARARKSGISIPGTDGLMAATAIRHGLHVLTRNTRHFEASGAMIVDPWRDH